MRGRYRFQRWLIVVGLSASTTVHADFLGIEVDLDAFALDGTTPLTALPGYEGQRVFNVYAAFDDPTDGAAGVVGDPVQPFQVATAGGTGFVNEPQGDDTPPVPDEVEVLPSLNWDSFVTIGLKIVVPPAENVLFLPGTPGPNIDPWPASPAVDIGWTLATCLRCHQCGLVPREACAGSYPDLRVLLMRLVVAPGETISGAFTLLVLHPPPRLGESIPTSFVANCETAGPDCNGNGLADVCDFESGFSDDVNGSGIPDECECLGDVALPEGVIDVADLTAVLDDWGIGNSAADINHDGIVDVQDLVLVILNWGPCA